MVGGVALTCFYGYHGYVLNTYQQRLHHFTWNFLFEGPQETSVIFIESLMNIR